MQKGFKIAAIAGALSFAMSGIATAAVEDLQFGGWSVDNGTIDHTNAGICADSNYDCSVVAVGVGFKQLQVSASAANTTATPDDSYIMTIVTDQTASGAYDSGDLGFTDVSFIRMIMTLGGTGVNTNVNGIFSEQVISEVGAATGTSTGTNFNSTTNLATGWAESGGSPISINQSLLDNGASTESGDDFQTAFVYSSDNDAVTGLRSGFEMAIDQVAGLQSASSVGSENDVQVFALRERAGSRLSSGGSATLGSTTTDWSAGDDIKATWIGQNISMDNTGGGFGGGSLVNSLGSTFGFMAIDNMSDSQAAATEFSFAASRAQEAWVWDDAFNVGGSTGAPCLNDPSGSDCL